MPNYIYWTKHIEKGVIYEDNKEEDDDTDLGYAHYRSFTNAIADKAEKVEGIDVLAQMLNGEKGCGIENVRKKLEDMWEDHKTPWYLDSKIEAQEVVQYVKIILVENNKL